MLAWAQCGLPEQWTWNGLDSGSHRAYCIADRIQGSAQFARIALSNLNLLCNFVSPTATEVHTPTGVCTHPTGVHTLLY
jgi:hypothetical protein